MLTSPAFMIASTFLSTLVHFRTRTNLASGMPIGPGAAKRQAGNHRSVAGDKALSAAP